MKAKRKRHDNAFKGRVALEALKGIKSIQAIAKEFDLHPMQVSEWKRKLQERLPGAFERGKKSDNDFEAEREKLHSKIGRLYLSRMNFRNFCLFLFPLAALPSLALCTHSAALGRLAREKSSSP